MDKFRDFLENKLSPVAVKLGNYKALVAVRDGMLLAMPLIIIGSIFLILINLPIIGYQVWLEGYFGLCSKIGHVVNSTFGMMGLIATFGIAKSMSEQYKVSGLEAGIIAIAAWLVLTPNLVVKDLGEGVPLKYLGSRGLFVGIIVGLLTGLIYQYFVNKDIVIKLPETVPPAVSKSFVALILGTIVITGAFLIELISSQLGVINVHDLILQVLGGPLGILGGTLVMSTIGTSQEGSDEFVIKSIAIRNKILGVDIQHIGDAGYAGLAPVENIFAISKAIRGQRHTVSMIARSILR